MAALVAALTLARRGQRVRLLLPERGVGGGFAALRSGDRRLELGVRLLELSYEGDGAPAPELSAYRPEMGGHRPYITLIDRWIRDLLGDRLVEVQRPGMVVGGRIVDDILFTVDLSALAAGLDDGERETMTGEVETALRRAGDPAGVLAPGHAEALTAMSLQEASLANHGPRFHERFIAPLCEKVLPGGAGTILAPLRRIAWAPLFHPGTLLAALRGERPTYLPQRRFHTVAPDGCGAIVDELLAQLQAEPSARVETAGPLTALAGGRGRTALSFAGGDPVRVRRPLLGTGAEELFAAAGITYAPERVRTAIAWLDVPSGALHGPTHLVHVLDADNPVLRLSCAAPAGRARRQVCVELRHDTETADLAAAARRGLIAAGLLDADARVDTVASVARTTFAQPSRATRERHAAARAALATRRFDVELLGPVLGLGADSLNEQIVQGLRAGELSP
ncbi:MAG: Uncharacterized protein JWM71_2158 [Solirubrobacteraceae bacterium]|nr:Uncharacterized protein [Solirubrobacteraceae bacterium]